jgi:hypothetical protein
MDFTNNLFRLIGIIGISKKSLTCEKFIFIFHLVDGPKRTDRRASRAAETKPLIKMNGSLV